MLLVFTTYYATWFVHSVTFRAGKRLSVLVLRYVCFVMVGSSTWTLMSAGVGLYVAPRLNVET